MPRRALIRFGAKLLYGYPSYAAEVFFCVCHFPHKTGTNIQNIKKGVLPVEPFEALYNTYQQDVFRFLLRLTGFDTLCAEELRAWLFQIAKHVYGKHIRKESRQRSITERQKPETVPPPDEHFENAEAVALLHDMIAALEEPARSVMQYRLYSGISYAEIAQLLGIKANTAAVIYNRTTAKLRRQLKERYGYEIQP